MGIDATIIEHEEWGNDIVSRVHGEGQGNVLLVGHTDTVYPVGIASARPVRLEEDMLYGPGVSDMKGCILLAIYAIEALLAIGYRPFKELRLLCVSDEETTSRHCLKLIEHASRNCRRAAKSLSGPSSDEQSDFLCRHS